MSEPFVFIGTHPIKPGKRDEFLAWFQEFSEFIEAKHPRLLHVGLYLDEGETAATVVLIQPDAAAMQHHMQVAGPELAKTAEFLEPATSMQAFGTPDEDVLATLRQMNAEAPLHFHRHADAFHRLPAL